MQPALSKPGRGLRAVLYAGGVVATAAGLHTVVAGGRSIIGHDHVDPSVESELRFYSAFYVAYGLLTLRVAPHAASDTAALRAIAGTLFLGGLARAGGWLAVGRPNRLQRALLAIELMGPPSVVAWQARIRPTARGPISRVAAPLARAR